MATYTANASDVAREASDKSSRQIGGTIRHGPLDLGSRVGVRFTAVAIPQGATITAATLTITHHAFSNDWVDVDAFAEDVDDSAAWANVAGTVIDRVLTSASATWIEYDGGTDVSPSLVGPVQEVVNRAGWASGNDLTLILVDITGETDYRLSDSSLPVLTVTHTGGGGESHSGGSTAVATATATSAGRKTTAGASIAAAAVAATGMGTRVSTGAGTTVVVVASVGAGIGPFTITVSNVSGDVLVEWEARAGASGYAVERDGTLLAFDITDLEYLDTTATGEHTYRVGVIL